jgi:D-alanyl-D-alanine carboxypeptidase/D-alanyl-D-alanine-endopeptidase (penicillin-binding protein 4)
MKIVTAAVLLDRLGPNYHFVTGLYGKKVGSEVAELVLRGRGDPSLSASDLLSLARSLQRSGVTKVGAILVDQSYFDAQFVPPAFDEQPDEWAPFRAPVSAVSVDGNAVTLNVQPTTPGSPARIWFGPEDVFATAGQVLTKEAGSGQHIGWTLKPQSSGLGSVVSGSVAADLPRQQFQKRLHDPRLVPGQALRGMLLDLGVQVGDRVLEGGADAKELLASRESPALSELVTHLGKDSDNFYAETLLKVLGAEQAGAPGTSAAGSSAIIKWLDEHQALVPGTQIINGSGLFNADRVSAATLCATLRAAFLDPRLQPEYVAQLSIAGVDGTLRLRLKSLAAQRSVRGKTGTLNSTVALSGYALGPSPTSTIAFSMIVDGVSGHHSEFRQRFDAIAVQLAAQAAAAH